MDAKPYSEEEIAALRATHRDLGPCAGREEPCEAHYDCGACDDHDTRVTARWLATLDASRAAPPADVEGARAAFTEAALSERAAYKKYVDLLKRENGLEIGEDEVQAEAKRLGAAQDAYDAAYDALLASPVDVSPSSSHHTVTYRCFYCGKVGYGDGVIVRQAFSHPSCVPPCDDFKPPSAPTSPVEATDDSLKMAAVRRTIPMICGVTREEFVNGDCPTHKANACGIVQFPVPPSEYAP